ncbi:DUF1553 domain-containing protein [Negadavirga shengliensis]|uniref:DUF1553 domain-containing protein n=1 Tax=Negadavirga shengliensis TaxID=1389218 RepID=A0ABV9SVG6_9BACT
MLRSYRIYCLLLIYTLVSCHTKIPDEIKAVLDSLPEALDYNVHVKPILSDKCFSCHGPDAAARQASLRLDLPENAYKTLESSGKRAITRGNLSKSEVYHRVISENPDFQMPPPESNLELSGKEKAILIKWIQDGAGYKKHWAFIPPEKPAVPQIDQKYPVYNAIDHFVIYSLESEGLIPSKEADKETLLRRLSLDLTGLPPTIEELEGFVSDNSPKAYEKQVDRLLASPHYGEQMAMHWMDIARFADTHGYTVDRYRDMSPWRDWVIKVYNENMPYDRFILYQLAGDLLPNPSKEQLLATAFNRIHPQNMEGGIVEEEFRVEYVADRTNTLGKAFMALSLECARCHDHKYDPITQKEYFQLSSFFNQVDEAGQISWDDAMPVPTMLWTDERKDSLITMLDRNVSKLSIDLQNIKKDRRGDFLHWLGEENHQKVAGQTPPPRPTAHFNFDRLPLQNLLNPAQKGVMESNEVKNVSPVLVKGLNGKAALLDGDAWLDMGGAGVFSRSAAFSVSIWLNLPEELENGAIFHTGTGAVLYNRRGYHLYLKDNKLELVLAHTAPYDAIIKLTKEAVPRNRWVNLIMTYDGSSKADGLKVFLDGKLLETDVLRDNLYKDILFDDPKQPGIQIGAVWRGKGLKGALVDDLLVYDRDLSALEALQIGAHQRYLELTGNTSANLTEEEQQIVEDHYWKNHSPVHKATLAKLKRARMELAAEVEPVQEVMIMQDLPEQRPTYLLERGEYHAHREEVFPGTPESLLPMPESLPKNRLGLAQWLVDKNHPLTARVAVNRIWQNFFGRGLVASTSDFGNQGEMPSHPELLDWLSVYFRESGWDVKALQKLIVMSATYRQASLADENLMDRDPENILLARGPSGRLSGEMIRDNVLYASGMLHKKIGGPSVKPYQPEGLWRVNGAHYEPDKGENLFRRSLYTIWKRSVPHPTLHLFDAPERSESTMKRQETNTPLQALVLMNDPIFVEAAKILGAQVSLQKSPETGVREIFRKLTGRQPNPKEMEILLELRDHELRKFRENPDKMEGWLQKGNYELQEEPDRFIWAANTVVASAIINADATITKR